MATGFGSPGAGVLALVVVGAGLGCGHGAPLSPAVVESAYLQARMAAVVCRSNDAGCCAERVGAARAAAASGDTTRAAERWQEVALACPALRGEAAAAVRAPGRVSPGAQGNGPIPAPEDAQGLTAGWRVLNVAYRARLSPAVRLYWVSASVGARLMPTAGSGATTPQPVLVEVQAIRFEGGRPGPLLRIERRYEVPFEPEAIITLEIAEVPGADGGAPSLEILPQVDAVPIARRRSDPAGRAALPSRPPPVLEKARLEKIDPLRTPVEFGTGLQGARPPVRLCLDEEGRLATLRFLEPTHPRLAASILDLFRDARYDPYRINDRAVPSCDVTRPS